MPKAAQATLIEEAAAQEQHMAILPTFSNGDCLWYPESKNDLRMENFREFYGIPADMTALFQ